MTQNQYQTLVSCPDCGNTQPFGGNLNGKRPHTRCTICKFDFDVLPNLEPICENNADDMPIQNRMDTYTDKKGNIYADSVPTVRKSKPYKSRWDPSNLSILRTFYYFLTGKNHRESKEDLIGKLIVELGKL